MRRRVWRRAKKRTAVIKGKTNKLLLLGREGSCGWGHLLEEGEGEVEERATGRSRPGQRLHGPVAAVLTLSDLRPTLTSTMNLTTHAPLSLFALRFTTLVRAMSSIRLLRPLPQTKSSSTALSTMFVPPPGLCLHAQPRVLPRLSYCSPTLSPFWLQQQASTSESSPYSSIHTRW